MDEPEYTPIDTPGLKNRRYAIDNLHDRIADLEAENARLKTQIESLKATLHIERGHACNRNLDN